MDAVPWISVVVSIYLTVAFVLKIVDAPLEHQIDDLIKRLRELEDANDELSHSLTKMTIDRDQIYEVVKVLTSKFVADEHPLTKVD